MKLKSLKSVFVFLGIVAAVAVLSWLAGGGYTAWRLISMGGAHQSWINAAQTTQWGRLILWDHFTQVGLLIVAAITLFCHLYGKVMERRFRAWQQAEIQRQHSNEQKAAYWHAKLS